MNLRAKLLIAAGLGGGLSVLLAELLHGGGPAPGRVVCYLLIVAVASRMRVVLPGIYGTMSVNLVVLLVSVVELSPPETVVLGCVAALIQTWRVKREMNLLHLAFNTADIAITVELCY